MSSTTAAAVIARKRAGSTKTGPDNRPVVPTTEGEKEVYETPDIDETDTHDADDGASRATVMPSDIDATPINPIVSFEKFAGKTFDLTRAGAEDALDRPPSYAVDSFSFLPKSERKFESPLETYQRLKKEVSQLLDEISYAAHEMENNKDKQAFAPFPPSLLSDLKSLQQALAVMATDKRLGGILTEDEIGGSTSMVTATNALADMRALGSKQGPGGAAAGGASDGSVTYEVYLDRLAAASHTSDAVTDEQLLLSQLNQRISSLETVVGSSSAITPAKDLKSLTSELQQRVQLLDPSHLDLVQMRVQTLTQTMDQAQQQRKNLPKAAAQKVDTLYDMMAKLEGTLDEIPIVIARLQSLQRIHEAGAQFVSDFQKLQAQQNTLTTMLSTQSKSLSEVESTMASNFETVMSNFKNIQTRMAALETKIGK